MIRPLSLLTAWTYAHVFKPLAFHGAPDRVHDHLTTWGGRIQRIDPARAIIHAMWAYENRSCLSQEIHGISFQNPVGLSAGFDKNFALVPLMKSVGFGFMEGGSLTNLPCAGNAKPWFYRLPKSKSIVVHVGLANGGTAAGLRALSSYTPNTLRDFPINISVAMTNQPTSVNEPDAIADYVSSVRQIQATTLGDMITLNISCPNTYGGEPFTTPDKLDRLLAAVDLLGLDRPLFLKMPIDVPWKEFKKLLDVADRHSVAGITLGNLAKNRSSRTIKDPLPDSVRGNMSGKPTWELSNALIAHTRVRYKDRFIIIGVGGIMSAKDAYTKIRLGADLVELITGLIFEGPQLVGAINKGLVKHLQSDGLQTISQAVGLDAAAYIKLHRA